MTSQVDMLCEVVGSLMAVAMVFTEEFSSMLFLLTLTCPSPSTCGLRSWVEASSLGSVLTA